MNDPHVEALFYRVTHPKDVDYKKAEPLEYEHAEFTLQLSDGRLAVRMKAHYPKEEAARETVEPFLRAWELDAALRLQPNELRFAFTRADVIDRDPSPRTGQVILSGVASMSFRGEARITIGRGKYPAPPVGIARDAVVEKMLTRFNMYREDRTTLADAAYCCLTELEKAGRDSTSGKRRAASSRYSIDMSVLSNIGRLSGERGGTHARKADGADVEFTSAEKRWLREAMRAIIRRAAEVADDATVSRKLLTMNDLPPLLPDSKD